MQISILFASTAPSRLALLTFCIALTSPLHGQSPIEITAICTALAHPTRFDGKRVEVHAKYAGTSEGTWLTDEGCDSGGEVLLPFDHNLASRYGVDDVLSSLSKRYGVDDVLRDKSWEQFDSSRRRLYTGTTVPTAGCLDYVTADFDGYLIIKRNFRMKNGYGDGWGHLGGTRFLLVLRSVSNVSPHPCAGTNDTTNPN